MSATELTHKPELRVAFADQALRRCREVADMEKTATLNLRVNPEVKKSAEGVLHS